MQGAESDMLGKVGQSRRSTKCPGTGWQWDCGDGGAGLPAEFRKSQELSEVRLIYQSIK